MSRAALHYLTDRNPEATREAVLTALHKLGRSAEGRELAQIVAGTDLVKRGDVASAVGWLHNARLIERAGVYGGSKRFRITAAGVAALALVEAMDEAEAV